MILLLVSKHRGSDETKNDIVFDDLIFFVQSKRNVKSQLTDILTIVYISRTKIIASTFHLDDIYMLHRWLPLILISIEFVFLEDDEVFVILIKYFNQHFVHFQSKFESG